MKLIPAIDVRCGDFVVFVPNQEIKEKFKKYTPVEVAKYWKDKGAENVYITDYDGLFKGSPQNLDVLADIKANVNATIYYSAGITTVFDLEQSLKTGADYVIVNVANLQKKMMTNSLIQHYIDQVVVGIDIMDGTLAIEGFNNPISINLEERLNKLYEIGLRRVLITDITKKGSNDKTYYKSVISLADKIGFSIILAGGIQSTQDLEEVRAASSKDFEAVVVGRGLYTGKMKYSKNID